MFVCKRRFERYRERERPKVQVREENLILFIYVLESELSKLLLKACH